MSFKKPRADAVLRNLPEAVHADLVRLLVEEGMSYRDVKDWLKETHKIDTSLGALSSFWNTDCLSYKLTKAKEAADLVRVEVSKARPDFDEATLGLISQRAFELIAAPGTSADELAKLIGAINDARRVDMKREELALGARRVKLLEEKAEADRRLVERASNEAKSGGITAATLEEMERRAKIL